MPLQFISLAGAILSLFLGPDGGPREGAIRLSMEKIDTIPEEEESLPSTPILGSPERRSVYGSLRHKLSGRLSGYFSGRGQDAQEGPSTPHQVPEPVPLTITPSNSANKMRTVSSTSRANGSAYGYGSTYRSRLASGYSTGNRRSVTASLRRRRESNFEGMPSSVATDRDLNFAQRLLMANENAVTNIADLWVAAAMNVDNEDPFEDEDEFEEDQQDVAESGEARPFSSALDDLEEEDVFGAQSATHTPRNNRFTRRESHTSAHSPSKRPSFSAARRPPPLGSPRRPSYSGRLSLHRQRSSQFSPRLPSEDPGTPPPLHRRASGSMPPIFAHVGVRTPPAVVEAQQLLAQLEEPGPPESLDPILESQRALAAEAEAEIGETQPSLMSLLPVAIIIQYGLLALHSTTHDQVFYLYLVS